MKFSIELEILIESIKISLLGESPEKLQSILKKNQIDWQKFIPFLEYHSIRPVVFDAFQKIDTSLIPSEIARYLQEYMFNQTILNLNYSLEIGRLLALFQANGLRALPYKGNLFIHQFYGNKQLREVGDMDFLFHPEDAKAGLKLLLEDGYQLKLMDDSFSKKHTQAELVELLFQAKGQYEVALRKVNHTQNVLFAVDFHWGLCYTFLPYQVDFNRFFETATPQTFYGKQSNVPSLETIFWMLELHHGGKEFWLRMKHFCDLIMYLKTYQEQTNWENTLETAANYNLKKTLLIGFSLLETTFGITPPNKIKAEIRQNNFEKVKKQTFDYWNIGQHWERLLLRYRWEKILILNQDDGFSKKKYFQEFFKTYSNPNPLENARLINFSENYPMLNFISKVISYVIDRTINKP